MFIVSATSYQEMVPIHSFMRLLLIPWYRSEFNPFRCGHVAAFTKNDL